MSSETRIKLPTRRARNGKGFKLEFDLCLPSRGPLIHTSRRGTRERTRCCQENQVHEVSDSDMEDEKEAPEGAVTSKSTIAAYLEEMFSNKFDTIQSMVERLPRVAPSILRSNPNSYADTLFVDEIALMEMPRKFSFPNIRMYDGTSDSKNHVAQYKQRRLTVAIQKEIREATMCKGFS